MLMGLDLAILLALGNAFALGLGTPLGAACVLPLYPGFLSFLASKTGKDKNDRKSTLMFGFLATLGVTLFMFLIGLLFTVIFQISLTQVIGVISPIAFGILAIIGILLIFNVDFSRFFPHISSPTTNKPHLDAFLFGFFFGPIVLPCNPAFISAMLATAFTTADLMLNMGRFLFFGLGMGFPLIVLSALSMTASKTIINFFTQYARRINLVVGIILLAVSLYYLFFVFNIFGVSF